MRNFSVCTDENVTKIRNMKIYKPQDGVVDIYRERLVGVVAVVVMF